MYTPSKYAAALLLAACGGAGAAPGFEDARPVADETLARLHAGADTVRNQMRVDGTVRDNHTSNVVSGANTIGAGAFANAAGMPVAIQNSGSNVLIQNATIINIQLQ
ncbi:hypothetical protein [Duganella sp. P38]|uniref:hypothetical protein n=1 Tax=Duganella sp. P38 TaxID=3423949 RepID=UPI003D7A1D4F